MMKDKPSNNEFFTQIVLLLQEARGKVVYTINHTMVTTYFEIGKRIVEEQQEGEERAEYGKQVIKQLSKVLTLEFGKGFSVRNIEQMRRFYIVYSKPQTLSAVSESKSQTASAKSQNKQLLFDKFKLSWSHYLTLMRIDDEKERRFYEIEATKNGWSVRELKRQYNTALYTRLVLSRDKEKVKELSEMGLLMDKPKDAIKDPYILEFLGLPEYSEYSECQLEQNLINKIEHFLLEFGNGFTFVARQKPISFDDKHFRIDLVFYNRIIKCFVLIDLKVGELKHQDLGQMQMYVNYYDRKIK